MSAITLNGLRVVSMRVVIPWKGVPFIDVDLDPDLVATAPSVGPAVIIVGSPPDVPIVTMLGMIDPLASGTFVATARVRVLAGKGGWSKTIPAQHFSDPSGALTSTIVFNATAAVVLEEVVDVVPSILGTDYARRNGRASSVFDRSATWWVDLVTGVTTVAPTRPPAIPDLSLEILSFDPLTQVAELACDTLILPGTLLVDPIRLGPTPLQVRSVEQYFDASGSHAKAFCSTNGVDRFTAALRTMVTEFADAEGLKVHRYRVISPGPMPKTVILQAVDRDPLTQLAASMPDLVPCAEWSGVPGCSGTLPPGLEVLVQFPEGDPTQPRIVGYSLLAPPLILTLDASVGVALGPSAPLVTIGAPADATPLARGPYVAALVSALATFATSASAATTAAEIATAAGALETALGSLPPEAVTVTTEAA